MNTFVVFTILVSSIVCVLGQYGGGGYGGGGYGGGGYGGGSGGGFGGGGHHHLEEYVDYRAPPHYHYDYAVHDLKHHDIKSQWETRDKDLTKGQYTILQPDGRKRIVEYVAGKHGIDYKIRYEGHSEHGGIGALSGGGNYGR